MSRKFIIGTMVAVFSQMAAAQSVVIKQVARSKNNIILIGEKAGALKVGQQIQLSAGCQVVVAKVKGSEAIASAQKCSDKSVLVPGRTITATASLDEKKQNMINQEVQSADTHEQTLLAQQPKQTSRHGFALKGLSVGVELISMDATLDVKLKESILGETSFTGHITDKSTLVGGATIRYSDAPLGYFGYDFKFSILTNQKQELGIDDQWTFLRAAGNAVFSLSNGLYGLAGLNLMKLTGQEYLDNYPVGVGLQLGGGYAFAQNMNLELRYSTTQFNFSDRSDLYEHFYYYFSGPEASLTYNF